MIQARIIFGPDLFQDEAPSSRLPIWRSGDRSRPGGAYQARAVPFLDSVRSSRPTVCTDHTSPTPNEHQRACAPARSHIADESGYDRSR